MLISCNPDSDFDPWNRYRGVDLEKTVETEGQVCSKICMALIPLADKSYKLEHNSRKMSRNILVVD
jgi:hypothetical protein